MQVILNIISSSRFPGAGFRRLGGSSRFGASLCRVRPEILRAWSAGSWPSEVAATIRSEGRENGANPGATRLLRHS